MVTPTPWQDYKNPVQPIRQKEPPASSVGHRGASHWSSTYKTSHDDNAIVGSVPWKLDHLKRVLGMVIGQEKFETSQAG